MSGKSYICTANYPGPNAAGAYRPTGIGYTTMVVKEFFGDSDEMAYVRTLVANYFMITVVEK